MSMHAPIEVPNFELLQEIGRGGMARVYLGNQLQPKRKIAVKIIAPVVGQDETFIQTLKQEGDTAALLNHPNVVTVYACGVVDGHYYLAMEHLGGGDLSELIKKGVTAERALEIMAEMASALECAHEHHLLHRDIKPENIMFHTGGRAVLVDFGIAKEQDTESNFTKAGAVVGTPHYMSPERATGKTTDGRSDLYALGVVFYEMLTGNKLYEGADTFAISYAHVYESIPVLDGKFVKYQGLLNKLVAKDPDDRYQNATELLKALKKLPAAIAPEPSTYATVAVAAIDPDSTIITPPTGFSSALPAATAAKSIPWIPIGAVVGCLVIAFIAFSFIPGGANKPSAASGDNLNTEQRMRMQDILQSAATFSKIGNYEQAEANLLLVLEDYDCGNQEARRGLQALNPGVADTVISACGR